MIIDTHMHIFDKAYKNEEETIINNALINNVCKMICVGYDYKTSIASIEYSLKFPFIYSSVGVHPNEVLEGLNLSWLKKQALNQKVVAIGEIGLDYYRTRSLKEIQIEFFRKQLDIASELNLSIIIHCRDAYSDCLNILKEYKLKGVLHCFSSSLEMAKEFIKLGYYIGVGGVLTFKNNVELKRVVKEIDLEYILSETDSPYLAPQQHRGKRNEPSYTKYVIEEIASIKNITIEEVCKQIEINTNKLFGI